MKIQNHPNSQRAREFVRSELFSLMLDVTAAYDSYGYRSYCSIILARHARLSRRHARLIIDREIQRRQPAFARSWRVSRASAGGAA